VLRRGCARTRRASADCAMGWWCRRLPQECQAQAFRSRQNTSSTSMTSVTVQSHGQFACKRNLPIWQSTWRTDRSQVLTWTLDGHTLSFTSFTTGKKDSTFHRVVCLFIHTVKASPHSATKCAATRTTPSGTASRNPVTAQSPVCTRHPAEC